MQFLKKILFLLTSRERKQLALILIMTLLMALLDMIGVASILPFIAVLTNPSIIETNIILNTMFEASSIFGVENNQQFLITLGIFFFLVLTTSITFKALTINLQIRFIQMCEYSIGKRLVESYLYQPYIWFLSRHSADLGKTVLSEVQQVVNGCIKPIVELITSSLIVITIITLLIIVDLKLTLTISLSLVLIYGLIFYFMKNYLNRIGKIRLKSNQSRYMLVSEAFGAFKEAKIGGLEKIFVKLFSDSAQSFARTLISSQVASILPRFILEIIVFGGVLLIILYKMSHSGNFLNTLPIVSLYIFAGYRLIPSLQQVYSSLTKLSFMNPSLYRLYEDFKSLKPINKNQVSEILSFNKAITLKNLYFNYPNTSQAALKNINLSIPVKSKVGFVGATGSGKTTIIDIISGLLETQKGSLEVDGKVITKHNLRSWQHYIGYVPQHIYLSDDTIAANIAFGVEPKYIKQEIVEKVSKIANLHKFVIDELPRQYKTSIGERGVRLSGGQRQRIGIARALYHNPQVLILDEATSALDNLTEKAVMDSINNLSENITIILIAHRLSTVKNCDKIFLLDKGQLKDKGTFEELMNNNDQFRNSAKIN